MPTATPEELDALYARDPDPWNFRTSRAEHAKYDHTLACLPRARYRHALEIGCSIGVLGQRLAARADRYLGIDASARALALTAAGAAANMRFARMMVPASLPRGAFDLIIVSEVLYFLGPQDVVRLAGHLGGAPEADIVSVNTLQPTSRELSGAAAAALFAAALGRPATRREAAPLYLIEVFGAGAARRDRRGAQADR
ncbi:hypothetical protein BH23PSE1_BH23PSE1_16130 [soil metagenome]